MANFTGISAAGTSIERLLTASFVEEQPVPGKVTRAYLVRTEDFVKTKGNLSFALPALTLFLYRIDFNKTMRAAWSAVGSFDGRGHLPVDLHFLVTAWADNAEYEHRILGRTLQCLETTPILSGPLLYPDPQADWATNEAVQLSLEEISTEAVMRTFDSLPVDYKLSIPYIARVIRLDSRAAYPSPPVNTVATGVKAGST